MSYESRILSRELSRRHIERSRLRLIREASEGHKPDDGIHFRLRMQKWLALDYYEQALNMHESLIHSQ